MLFHVCRIGQWVTDHMNFLELIEDCEDAKKFWVVTYVGKAWYQPSHDIYLESTRVLEKMWRSLIDLEEGLESSDIMRGTCERRTADGDGSI